jgi:hypothetical protein
LSAPSLLAAPPSAEPSCCGGETWKPVPDWPQHEASTCGRVRRIPWIDAQGCLHVGGILPQHPDKRKGKGYLYVTLREGSRRRKAHVAVLVLEAHRELKPGPGYEACHGNGRTDNHLRWLRWDTKAANLAEMWEARRVTLHPAGVTDPSSQARRGVAMASRHDVTGDGLHGTGRSPIPLSFLSQSASVQPVSRTLRNQFRFIRNRLAA